MPEMRVQSLGWEDPLEEEMTTHSSTLAWEIPWTEEPGGLQHRGRQESDVTERLSTRMTGTHYLHPPPCFTSIKPEDKYLPHAHLA